MNLTVFQRLVLHVLAVVVWHSNERALFRLLRTIANGHHTDDQKESLLNEWKRDDGER